MISKIAKIKLKKNKSKIVCLTAYSKNIAQAIDKHVDIILVGDSKMKFVKKFIDAKKIITNAAKKFKLEVKSKKFPTKKYSY